MARRFWCVSLSALNVVILTHCGVPAYASQCHCTAFVKLQFIPIACVLQFGHAQHWEHELAHDAEHAHAHDGEIREFHPAALEEPPAEKAPAEEHH